MTLPRTHSAAEYTGRGVDRGPFRPAVERVCLPQQRLKHALNRKARQGMISRRADVTDQDDSIAVLGDSYLA